MKRLISVLAVSILIISSISAISSHSESQKYSYIVVFKHPSMIDFSLNTTNGSKLLKYREYLKNLHDKFINWLEEKTGKTKFKEFFNVLNAVKIRVPSSIVPLIESLPYVRSVYPDIRVQSLLAYSRSLIRLDYALNIKNLTGEGVTVAVLDTGIDYTHPDLKNCYAGGYDFVNDDSDPFDDNGHGTHVCGIIAGNGKASNGTYRGIAPDSKLYVYKVLDENGMGYASDIIEAIEKVIDPNGDGDFSDHLDILSLSLGVSDGDKGGDPDDLLSESVDKAVDAGIVVIVSAGNDGWDVKNNQPVKYTISSPACARKAIAVGAVTHMINSLPSGGPDRIALYSSKGPSPLMTVKPDIVAPGGDVDIFSSGSNAYNYSITSTRATNCSVGKTVNEHYTKLGGTSMAAPHVSGIVALLMQEHPDWDPFEIRSALRYTARDLGYPLTYQGFGRVDAYELLINLPAPPPVAIFFDVEKVGNGIVFKGIAKSRWFDSYRLYYKFMGSDRPDEFDATEDGWILLYECKSYVKDDTLCTWDISDLGEGWYEVKLIVRDDFGRESEDYIMVHVSHENYIIDIPSSVHEGERFRVSVKNSDDKSLRAIFIMCSPLRIPRIKMGRDVEFRAYRIFSEKTESISVKMWIIVIEPHLQVEKREIVILND